MVSINTNLSSLIVQGNLTSATTGLNKAIERLSTGYKINHASDNAANYSIANSYESKMSSYEVAASNVQSGLDLLSVAQDTISTMQDHGSRLQALITQARNGTYGQQSLNAMTQEAGALISEIQRMYTNAEYNGINLFDNSPIPAWVKELEATLEPKYNGFISEIETVTPDIVVESAGDLASAIAGNTIIGIADASVLAQLSTLVNSGTSCTGKTIVLTDDIDLSAYQAGSGWTAIGTESKQFKGTFDGQGHKVTGLKINKPSANYQGLFGYTFSGSNIKNVGIVDCDIKGKGHIGGLVGYANGSITNSYSKGVVKGRGNTAGLVGYADSDSSVTNSYSTGDVTGTNGVGGLVGCFLGNITNSFATGNITGESFVGGFVGNYREGTIDACYSNGKIHGNEFVGGFIGIIDGTVDDVSVEISNSVSFGKISATDKFGSFIGGYVNKFVLDYGDDYQDEYTTTLTLSNCQGINLGMNKIGGCYTHVYYFGDVGNLYELNSSYDMSSLLNEISGYNLKKTETTLQVGIHGNDSSKIDFNTNFDIDLSAILTDIKSDKAYSTITNFMSTLSAKATDLGAISNRLESSLESIAVSMQNLGDSLSTVKDIDMAEVSSEYIKKQILQQASATLLATANQSPAIALQLI